MFLNKTPAEQRDIFRPELFYNYINLRLKNNSCTIKTLRSSKKRKLRFIFAQFWRKHVYYSISAIVGQFSYFRHYAT